LKSEASHAMYSCKQKRLVREQEEGRNAQVSLNRRKEGQINMSKLGRVFFWKVQKRRSSWGNRRQ
jgi:hypothetical protein